MIWYQFTPSDTLFFRGAEPLVSGMNYETKLAFPPSVSVIAGAIRTAVLAQKGIDIKGYKNGNLITNQIGKYGEKAPFKVIGPLIRQNDEDFVPAPYTWYFDGNEKSRKISIIKPMILETGLKQRLGLKTSTNLMNWAVHEDDVKSIGGGWISLIRLLKGKTRYEIGKSIFMPARGLSELFSVEQRTGNALDPRRKAEESKLYSSRHIRLKENVSLIWATDRECALEEKGVLTLGGEQRFGYYELLKRIPDFPTSGEQYLALSPVPVCEESIAALIGTGDIIYRGGWDLAEQFHKNMEGFYSAGSVFSENINDCCIPF